MSSQSCSRTCFWTQAELIGFKIVIRNRSTVLAATCRYTCAKDTLCRSNQWNTRHFCRSAPETPLCHHHATSDSSRWMTHLRAEKFIVLPLMTATLGCYYYQRIGIHLSNMSKQMQNGSPGSANQIARPSHQAASNHSAKFAGSHSTNRSAARLES